MKDLVNKAGRNDEFEIDSAAVSCEEEGHGINVVPVMEEAGLEFQFGQNVVTWISLLFF